MTEGEVKVITLTDEEMQAKESSKLIKEKQEKLEYNFLKNGDCEGYIACRENFLNQKIPDYTPMIFDAFTKFRGGSTLTSHRPTLSTSDYLSLYYNNHIRSQDDFMEYLRQPLIDLKKLKLIKIFVEEHSTRHGACDLFVKGKESFLLELKINKITRKDIYQCFEYKKATESEYPVAIVGYGCDESTKKLAEELCISVYVYKLSKKIPTKIDCSLVTGHPIKTMNKIFGHEYIMKHWRHE